jgi:hypothetical protein
VTPRKYVVLYDVVVVVCFLLAISDTVRGATVETVEGLNPWIARIIQSLDESANVPILVIWSLTLWSSYLVILPLDAT